MKANFIDVGPSRKRMNSGRYSNPYSCNLLASESFSLLISEVVNWVFDMCNAKLYLPYMCLIYLVTVVLRSLECYSSSYGSGYFSSVSLVTKYQFRLSMF